MLSSTYSVARICQTLGVAKSSFYYRAAEPADADLRAALLRLAEEWPCYGRPRLTQMLKRAGFAVGQRRVAGLMHELGLLGKRAARKPRTTNSQHSFARFENLTEGLVIEKPDQVWVADITYVGLGQGFVYLAVLMDVFTRCIRGWHLSKNLDADLTLRALHRGLQKHRPKMHHSDQGVQYACSGYVRLLRSIDCQISMAAQGDPRQNGYAERLVRTIKEEHIALTEYADFEEAVSQIGRFLDEVYMHKRIHSSLGYLTPVEFESQWRKEQALALQD